MGRTIGAHALPQQTPFDFAREMPYRKYNEWLRGESDTEINLLPVQRVENAETDCAPAN